MNEKQMQLTKAKKHSHSTPRVSIIVPVYNEEATIVGVLRQLQPYAYKRGFSIIVVNDASTDETANIVQDFGYVKLINHPYNKGYGAAIKTGMRTITSEYILTMDGDGQHDTREIPKLLEYIDEYDMVIGSRLKNGGHDWIRKPGKWVLSKVANYLSSMKIPDVNSGFRLIRKSCIEEFEHILPNGFSLSTTLTLALIKAGYNVKFVPITIGRRQAGKSSVRQGRDGLKALLLIIRCISLFNPLKVYVPVALSLIAASTVFAMHGIIIFRTFPKSAIVVFLTGIIILFFGILSDQIAANQRCKH